MIDHDFKMGFNVRKSKLVLNKLYICKKKLLRRTNAPSLLLHGLFIQLPVTGKLKQYWNFYHVIDDGS